MQRQSFPFILLLSCLSIPYTALTIFEFIILSDVVFKLSLLQEQKLFIARAMSILSTFL
jgi:hypothetical protein